MNQKDFLLQFDITKEVLPKVGTRQWQTLYHIDDVDPHRFGMWCALLDEQAAAKAITRDSWDLHFDDGRPGFSQCWLKGKQVTTYHRFSSAEGVRPLVLHRSFFDAFPQYVELDEEFRLYHNLAHESDRGLLLSFNASGREIEVVQIVPKKVRARMKYLREFQAATGLYMAVYIDSVRYSKMRLNDVPLDQHSCEEVGSSIRWRRSVSKCDFIDGFETFSRLLGKKILAPPPRESAGVWPFTNDNEEPEVTFIVNVDQHGNNIESTSHSDKMGDYFGANSEAYDYLTPVFFRREVLAKYFAEPDRYRISDGLLTCLSLWSCQIDNDLDTHVVVFLGDLGRDLPYEEKLHWRQFNVPPEGGVSRTNFRRSFLAQATSPRASDLTFRQEYSEFVADWAKAQGWSLFLPLSSRDEHILNTIRVPVTNSQAEMDEQVSYLAKLLVDSLNEKELTAKTGDLGKGTKGIGKLAGFLEATQFPQRRMVVQFLRDLQNLRSTGSAHRKGSGYDKTLIRLGIQSSRKPDAVRLLLEKATVVLRDLRLYYCGP